MLRLLPLVKAEGVTFLLINNRYSTNKVTLYCSSANQYKWLQAYAGQEITLEVAACNWNDKSFYAGCVLAVVNADGTKTINELNFQ